MKIFDVEYVSFGEDSIDEFTVSACCFFSAVEAAISVIEKNIGLPEDGYDILKIELLRDGVYTPTEECFEESQKKQLVN